MKDRSSSLTLGILGGFFGGALIAAGDRLFFTSYSSPEHSLQAPLSDPLSYRGPIGNVMPTKEEWARAGLEMAKMESDELRQQLHTLEERLRALANASTRTPVPPEQTLSSQEEDRRQRIIDSLPFYAGTENDPIPTSYLTDVFDALALQADTNVHPSVLKGLYAAGLETVDLLRLKGDLSDLAHIHQRLPLPSEAQVDVIRAIDVYDQNFMETNNISPNELFTLPQNDPTLFRTYRMGKWRSVSEWFQKEPPGVGHEQVLRAINYMNSPTGLNHLEQAITESIEKASQQR